MRFVSVELLEAKEPEFDARRAHLPRHYAQTLLDDLLTREVSEVLPVAGRNAGLDSGLGAFRRGDILEPLLLVPAIRGASQLLDPETLQLRFATSAEAEASKQRLSSRFPGSDDVWLIRREWTPGSEE